MKKTVVVLGKGELAIRVATWFRAAKDYELVAAVPVVPEPEWTDSLIEWCAANNVPVVPSGDFRDLPDVVNVPVIDVGFSIFYDKILTGDFINGLGQCLNLHNGPLPRYRGVSPINWALRNGESVHGTTIHEITPGVDDGPVVAQVCYSIYPAIDEVEDVYRRALAYGWTLFEQTMPILDRIDPAPQDEARATHYTKKDNGLLGDRRGFRR